MNELGLVRVTEDIDLLIDGSPQNQQLVRLALRILPERAIDELGPDEDLRCRRASRLELPFLRIVYKAQR